jgi:hypothetical protein
MTDSKGALVPIELVKSADKLRDQLVRELAAAAEEASKSLAEFKAKAFAEVDAFLAMVADKYGAKAVPGGEKGNVTLLSYDGRVRIQVQVADVISFKSEDLQACKSIIDALIAEWSADSQAEIRAIVMNAFRVDNAGQINRGALLGLLRLDIQDPRWVERHGGAEGLHQRRRDQALHPVRAPIGGRQGLGEHLPRHCDSLAAGIHASALMR